MRKLFFWVMMSFLLPLIHANPLRADGEPAGDFDYYVLSLSWSPNWCALEGDGRNAPECEDGAELGWTMHGLWPQYEQGWPSYCNTVERNPSRSDTAEMADIMGSGGLAWHQWNKHGRCSGLSSDAYYALSREAYELVTRPTAFRRLQDDIRLPASVVQGAFLAENGGMTEDGLTVTCRENFIQEVRICLTPDLEFRTCGQDTIRDCSLSSATMQPLR